MEDRMEAARDVMRNVVSGADWDRAFDPDMPAAIAEFGRTYVDVYRRGDVDWLLEHTDPEVVIVQVPEIPDARTYTGRDGMIDALLDWPRQWDDFRIHPRRVFSPDGEHLVVVAIHSGRPPSIDLEVEAEIVFLFGVRDQLVTCWEMFMTLDEALSRAAERRAHGDDDRAAESHGRERA
jgi:ketosteroid isomerase-like protein